MVAMYPAVEVPAVQLSTPSLDPEALLRLGERLRTLREGILVISSGTMTHSFTVFRRPEPAGHTAAFDEWATDAIARSDVDALLDYRAKGPSADIAHPTADHFVPLLLTLGAGTTPGQSVTTAFDGMWMGNSIRSVQAA